MYKKTDLKKFYNKKHYKIDLGNLDNFRILETTGTEAFDYGKVIFMKYKTGENNPYQYQQAFDSLLLDRLVRRTSYPINKWNTDLSSVSTKKSYIILKNNYKELINLLQWYVYKGRLETRDYHAICNNLKLHLSLRLQVFQMQYFIMLHIVKSFHKHTIIFYVALIYLVRNSFQAILQIYGKSLYLDPFFILKFKNKIIPKLLYSSIKTNTKIIRTMFADMLLISKFQSIKLMMEKYSYFENQMAFYIDRFLFKFWLGICNLRHFDLFNNHYWVLLDLIIYYQKFVMKNDYRSFIDVYKMLQFKRLIALKITHTKTLWNKTIKMQSLIWKQEKTNKSYYGRWKTKKNNNKNKSYLKYGYKKK